MKFPGSEAARATEDRTVASGQAPATDRKAKPRSGRPSGARASSEKPADASAVGARLRPTAEGPPAASPATQGAGQARMKLLIPAYFYPAGPGLKHWERLIEAASRVPIVAIANPASGPGEEPNADYKAIIGRARRGGITVVGYIGTNYAHRPLAEVQAEVDRWVRFYPEIGGIFFDAQPSEPGHADYYVSLRDHVGKKIGGAAVITNPGTICDEQYAARLNSVVLCVFGSPAGFEDFRLPRWAERHPSGRFGAMASHVSNAEQMRDCIQIASSRGVGLVYVTDAKAPNPWDRLPAYWSDEVEAVRRVNSGQAP